MQKVTFLILLFLISALAVSAQPKKASVIIVSGNLDSATVVLSEMGYIVKTGVGKVVYTEPKASKHGALKFMLNQKDSLIYVRGEFSVDAISSAFNVQNNLSKIENRGMKGSAFQDTWKQMVKIAAKIGEIRDYLIE